MNRVRRIVEEIVSAGYQIDGGALEILRQLQDHPELDGLGRALISDAKILAPVRWVIDRDMVAKAVERLIPPTREQPSEASTRTVTSVTVPFANEISSRITIMRDPGSVTGSGATIADFSHYFRDRFERLRSILRQRSDARDARTIGEALSAPVNQKVKLIAMVMEKRERKQNLFLEIDDLEDVATVLVARSDDSKLLELAQKLPLDQVVCIEAVRGRGNLLVAENIILPDVPDKKVKGADEHVYAVLLSDLHVGSKMFLEEAVNRMLQWLNGKLGGPNQVELAHRTKYVIIAGDLVDGVGVYPRQEEELAVSDIYEQYRLAAQYVEQIPEYMDVILIPGNHDAVRQALPQPPILKEFAEPVYGARDVKSLGNPAEVRLHDIHFLLHHGKSLDDLIITVPGMNFDNPERAMEFQLRCRHLAPEYGKRTSIAPEKADPLIIEESPDVFQSGHIHVTRHLTYRGVQVINSGAWQAQTEYQRRMGIKPTPGILPVVNLQTLQVSMINFLGS